MTHTLLTCVIDASIGVKAVVEEPGSDRVEELLAHLTGNPSPRFYVPDLFYVECANILWKYTRRFGYSQQEAREGLALLRGLEVMVVPIATLVDPALQIAMTYGISAYDACYIALSDAYSTPLITADQRLVNCMNGSPYTVCSLADFSIPSLPTQ